MIKAFGGRPTCLAGRSLQPEPASERAGTENSDVMRGGAVGKTCRRFRETSSSRSTQTGSRDPVMAIAGGGNLLFNCQTVPGHGPAWARRLRAEERNSRKSGEEEESEPT